VPFRNATPVEYLTIIEGLNNIPEQHRDTITQFTTSKGGLTKGYYLIDGEWMVDDFAVMVPFEIYYCPTEKKLMDCPGPCPDGTPHQLMKKE
jgi:hypothetical protein